MESWKTHPICQMGISWFHLLDGSFMIPSGRWVFHDSIWQMGLSWFARWNHERPICQMESWKTHLPDGIMKDPSARWNHERPICQMESWKTHPICQMGLSWFHLLDGSFMIPSVRWVFHDLTDGIMKDPSNRWNHERPICQMESWKTHLPDGIMKDPSARWNHERPI